MFCLFITREHDNIIFVAQLLNSRIRTERGRFEQKNLNTDFVSAIFFKIKNYRFIRIDLQTKIELLSFCRMAVFKLKILEIG